MKRSLLFFVSTLCLLIPQQATLHAQTEEARLAQAATSFSQRIAQASEELASARQRIGREKAELSRALRQTEDRVLALRAEVDTLRRSSTTLEQESEQQDLRLSSLEENRDYVFNTLAESLKIAAAHLGPGQRTLAGELQQRSAALAARNASARGDASALAAIDHLEARLLQQMGGYAQAGTAATGEEALLLDGHFIHLGPSAYFLSADPDRLFLGTARERRQSPYPLATALESFQPLQAAPLLEGEPGILPVDATGSDALLLAQARGNLWQHIAKGGNVGYIIIALGFFALLTAIFKLIELRRLAVEPPGQIKAPLELLSRNSLDAFSQSLASVKATTRELFTVGLAHVDKPKDTLEEHLYANILVHRLRHERRLPQLRVIAAATPLLGLLGTVVGMVKTFTLITVHGSGDAEKLSSGISQALVTTELGLIVAIPTLVLYGFLAQRAHHNLSLLEQHAVAFVAAAQDETDKRKETLRP